MEKMYKNLKELADFKRMTLTQLAAFLGLSRQTFGFRLKHQKVTHQDLKRLSEYMEVPMEAFLSDNPLSYLEKSEKSELADYNRVAMLENILKEKDNIIASYRELLSEYRKKKENENESGF